MAFKVLAACPHCGTGVEISIGAFMGEGNTELQRFCTACHKHFVFIASFSTSLVDQVLISSPEFSVSVNCNNFSKAQPQRELNKRIRMWRTISSTCKLLKNVFEVVASEFPSCVKQVDELNAHIKEVRGRLRSEGVIPDGNPKKGKSGISSQTAPGEIDPVWLSKTGGGA